MSSRTLEAPILVTGASGFIGRHVLARLPSKHVVALTSREDTSLEGFEGRRYRCDLLDPVAREAMMADVKPRTLIHLAWGMEPSNYDLDSNWDWLLASIELVRSFREHGGRALLAAGSCVQYDWGEMACAEARTRRNQTNSYAIAKNLLEEFTITYCLKNDMRCVWAIPFFMYGPHEDPRRLVPDITHALLRGETATVKNGALERDFLHVQDVADLMLDLLHREASGAFNIASGTMVSLGEVGRVLADVVGRSELLVVNQPEQMGNRYVVADMSRTFATTDWRPSFELRRGLEDTLRYWSDHEQ